ncbi:unnamed protein product [Moneuplotes crassus]|uniref:Uncharacterized protein n=1 Tax=Euplotes crassus TaxID=5936 RepID=A0AAD2D2D7_EUPCR|nr:unnamed protein product [Moneuplotes crassus]
MLELYERQVLQEEQKVKHNLYCLDTQRFPGQTQNVYAGNPQFTFNWMFLSIKKYSKLRLYDSYPLQLALHELSNKNKILKVMKSIKNKRISSLILEDKFGKRQGSISSVMPHCMKLISKVLNRLSICRLKLNRKQLTCILNDIHFLNTFQLEFCLLDCSNLKIRNDRAPQIKNFTLNSCYGFEDTDGNIPYDIAGLLKAISNSSINDSLKQLLLIQCVSTETELQKYLNTCTNGKFPLDFQIKGSGMTKRIRYKDKQCIIF